MVYSSRLLCPAARRPVVVVRGKATAAVVRPTNTQHHTNTSLSLLQLYQHHLERRPLLTKALMAAGIFFVSDTVTQYVLPGPSHRLRTVAGGDDDNDDDDETMREWQWDASRALSGAGFGVLATSWLHYWWGFLETAAARVLPVARHRLANTLVKVAMDQLLGAPLYIYSYYVLTNVLQDLQHQRVPVAQSWCTNHAKATEMLWPTMMQHWKLWPAVHSLNFYFMPLHHRVLVQNCVLVGWSGYLSHLNHAETKLMTPDEEIKVTIVRRETELRLKKEAALEKKVVS